MTAHVFAKNQISPLLIFPEGTCVNNEYTVLFHKGAFSLNCAVCPVAIKYNKRFGDPYWMSARQSFVQHVLYLMSRPALVADVWWMEPVWKMSSETEVDFAQRVKKLISEQAGLQCLSWDGYLKNYFTEEKRNRLKSRQQNDFANGLRNKIRASNPEVSREDETISSLDSVSSSLSSLQYHAIKNNIIIELAGNFDKNSDLRRLSSKQDDVIRTWKQYTRIKDPEVSEETRVRRMENSSWRLWFRERQLQDKKAMRS